jgi:DNA-directed RNA polymerase specialized sigma24 family protein
VEPTELASPDAVVAALRSRDTHAVLFRYAVFLTGSPVDGEDLLSEAVAEVCDLASGRPWAPGKGSFLTHMRFVLHDLARRERRSARARRERPDARLASDEGGPDGEPFPDGGPLADEALDDARDRHRRGALGERLRSRLGGDALAAFDAMSRGLESVAELSAHLGLDAEGVYRVKKVIAYHAQRVRAEEAREPQKSEPSDRPRATPPEVP